MARLYQDWQQELAAYWLRIGYGGRWLKELGSLKDEIEYRARAAAVQRFPDHAADDSLAALFAERQLERPAGTSNAQAAAKLKDAFNRWYWGGTPYGLLREFSETLPGVLAVDYQLVIQTQQDASILKLVSNTGDPTADVAYVATPPAPELSFSFPRRWNTFAVVLSIAATHPWWFATPNDASSAANTARRVIQRWRAQHTECRYIVVQSDPDALLWGTYDSAIDNVHAWGDGSTWGSAGYTVYWTPPTQ